MKSFVVVCLAFSCALLVSADINDVKKNAVKKLDSLAGEIKKLADDTSVEVGKREGNIKIITEHERKYGDGIFDKIKFEVSYNARSAYMLANLLGSGNEVFRCIETREREAVVDTEKTYSSQFLQPGRDLEVKAEQYQRDLIKAWKDDYYKSISQYADIYKKAVADIQKSNSESNINTIVKQFTQTTGQMADIIVSIHTPMAKTHIQVLRTLDQYVVKFQEYSRYRVDETAKAIQKCFPKLLQLEDFLTSFVF